MSRYRYQREIIFAPRTVDEVSRFLKDKPNTDLSQVLDDKSNTALHHCSYLGSFQVLKEYVGFMKIYWRNNRSNQQNKSVEAEVKYLLKQWINQRNQEGFTCLHYAAFKGQIEMLNYLTQLGADINIKTNSGLGVLHLASQGDKVKTFVYFREKTDINEPDDRKSTPLHWAAFNGSETVTDYLLSQQNIQLNLKDVEQQTPLYLATDQGNTKIVRKLLIAGADRHLKDKNGKEAIYIAKQNDFTSTQILLNDQYTCMDQIKFFFNLKMKYEPTKRSITKPILFLILSFILIGTITLGLNYHEEYKPIFYVQEGFFGILILLYLSLILQKPKKQKGSYQAIERVWLKKDNKQNSRQRTQILSSVSTFSFQNQEVDAICLHCIQYKPPRSNHCDTCNTCIENFDHHCPWINNCVGRHNIARFNIFLILIILALCWILVIGIQFILVLIHDEDDVMGFFQINPFLKGSLPLLYGFVFIAILLDLIFFFPLFLLMTVNITNILLGKTTYERFSKQKQPDLSRSRRQFMGRNNGEQNSKRGKISCSNCLDMCISKNQDRTKLLP